MKFENAALSLLFGLPSTLIRHESGSFLKTLFKPEPFKSKCLLRVLTRIDGETFENDNVTKITWFPWPSSSITNPNWLLIVALLISPTYDVDGKQLTHFGVKSPFPNFFAVCKRPQNVCGTVVTRPINLFVVVITEEYCKDGEGCIGVDSETNLPLKHGWLLGKTPHEV